MYTTHFVRWCVLLGISLAGLLVCSAHMGDVTAQPQGQLTTAIHRIFPPNPKR